MKFLQNVPNWERLLRFLLGAAMVIGALMALKPGYLAYGIEATGGVLLLTSVVGFCPMCALAGRKLRQTHKKGTEP